MKQLTNWYEDKKQLNFAIPLLEEGKKEKGDIEWEIQSKVKNGSVCYAIFRENWDYIKRKKDVEKSDKILKKCHLHY